MQFIKLHTTEAFSRIGSDSYSIAVAGLVGKTEMRFDNIITAAGKEIFCPTAAGNDNYVTLNFGDLSYRFFQSIGTVSTGKTFIRAYDQIANFFHFALLQQRVLLASNPASMPLSQTILAKTSLIFKA